MKKYTTGCEFCHKEIEYTKKKEEPKFCSVECSLKSEINELREALNEAADVNRDVASTLEYMTTDDFSHGKDSYCRDALSENAKSIYEILSKYQEEKAPQ